VEDEEEEEEVLPNKNKSNDRSGSVVSLLKATIKDKVEKKIAEKEPQKVISFPKDKPTFNISLLAK
jgi:hypothetical protein